MRHCEWFGWTRGIYRPTPHSRVDGDLSRAEGALPLKFCPACGGKVKSELGQGSGEYVCTNCGKVHYENSKPCAVAVIERDGKVLLNRRLIEPGSGKWDFVGGFLDKGEHPEVGLHREVKEELGVGIAKCEVLGMYMDVYGEDKDATLNIAYSCQIYGEPRIETDEFDEIRWFPLDKLPNEYSFDTVKTILADLSRRENKIDSMGGDSGG